VNDPASQPPPAASLTTAAAPRARERFRAFPLDGALLFFQPSTGTSLRIRNSRTADFRRRAPRVVMFGVTNHCNLRCSFCSRDIARASDWTVRDALTLLQGLAQAGSLEVAFGGGEPFAFRGFHELANELRATTELALHVTTNGLLLDERSFGPFRGLFGQVRLSIYDSPRWRAAAATLRDARQLWGANVLVDARKLPALPALFAELVALGCHDVSVLRYVGGDPSLQLDDGQRKRLAAIIEDAPLRCRVSVCFGDALSTPLLFDGVDDSGDCGAGYDFVTITPDRRVQSCSFQDTSVPAGTAADVLAAWQKRGDELTCPSRRLGCARAFPRRLPAAPRTRRDVLFWRAFSGNNSGECILVGKFASDADAQRYLAELSPGWQPVGEYSAEWRALFEADQVMLASTRDDAEGTQSPRSLLAVGRSILAVGYDAGDAFPELRALTWKRAGYVAPGGIHVHESPSLLSVIRCRDEADARRLLGAAPDAHGRQLYGHGVLVFVRLPDATRGESGTLIERARYLERIADGRPLGVELLCDDWDEKAFVEAKQRLGVELATTPRLEVSFHGGDAAHAAKQFARHVTEADARAHAGCALVQGLARRKRLAVLAIRQGATVTPLDGTQVDIWGLFWFLEPPRQKRGRAAPRPAIDAAALGREISSALGVPVQAEPGPSWRNGVQARVRTADPAEALGVMDRAAERLGTQLHLSITEIDPLAFALRRLLADVDA
jgi:MoaA/NifB/PqqE/SkfB family radical SAM enzyme